MLSVISDGWVIENSFHITNGRRGWNTLNYHGRLPFAEAFRRALRMEWEVLNPRATHYRVRHTFTDEKLKMENFATRRYVGD